MEDWPELAFTMLPALTFALFFRRSLKMHSLGEFEEKFSSLRKFFQKSLDPVNGNVLHDATDMRTYSTRQAAKMSGIHWVTLRRWLAGGKIRPSQALPYERRTLWCWTELDIKRLREFKNENYRKGRGRKKERAIVLTQTEVIPPKRFSEADLERAGVTILSSNAIWLECKDCEVRWSPNLRPGGKLPKGYWRCPNSCNVPK